MNTKQQIKFLEELKTHDNFKGLEEIQKRLLTDGIVNTLKKFDKRLKEVERQAGDNWASFEYVMDCFEEKAIKFKTDGVDNLTYNGKPISEIKVGEN
ncbi:unnamed protein product, partial [marine sediment metagenome]